MAQFFDHQGRGIAIENFVDRRHGTHLHQNLDDIAGFDRHALRQFGDRNSFGNFDITHNRRGGFDELMLARDFVNLLLPLLELLLAAALLRRILDVQFLATVTRVLVFVLAMLAGFFGSGGRRTGRGSRFERGPLGLLRPPRRLRLRRVFVRFPFAQLRLPARSFRMPFSPPRRGRLLPAPP